MTVAVVALEGVDKTKPVAGLVGTDGTDGALGKSAAVTVEGVGSRGSIGGVVAVSRSTREGVKDVEVHGLVVTTAQGPLHGHLLAVALVGPLGVDGAGSASIGQGDAVAGEAIAEGVELALEGGVRRNSTL